MIRRLTLVAVPLVLVAGGVAAVVIGGHDDRPGPAQGRIEVADGAVTVTTEAGGTETVTGDALVDFGDTVAVDAGSAVLELADGATYELRHHDGVGATVVVGSPPRLLAGDALVVDGFPARIHVGAATLSAQGVLRVDAEAEEAAVYTGRTRVAGAGDVDQLVALRRLVLVPGGAPAPVRFDGTDPWDRRYLGEAIALGERLEALARGYTSTLAADAEITEALLRRALPGLADERELGADLLSPARPAGELLVGAAIAVQGREGTFRDRWAATFAFREAGAAWGLVALDQGVSSAPVLDAVELAVGTPVSAAAGPSTTTGTARTPGTTSTTATQPTTTTTAPGEPDPPPPEPSSGLLGPVVDPANEVLRGLLEGLLRAG